MAKVNYKDSAPKGCGYCAKEHECRMLECNFTRPLRMNSCTGFEKINSKVNENNK